MSKERMAFVFMEGLAISWIANQAMKDWLIRGFSDMYII